ncbi:hypothetical protein Acr_20g0001910 [Actinidia rufa]|uniref:F-box associated beta-propeller type 3 domain-containing protein n=1 Tax=Actinidia rufa TaxID=165716 RepID=A0A7J0GC67_9ERIC|nr:hypothetical protein Acr_20g0001910 [Actinidia rufa]
MRPQEVQKRASANQMKKQGESSNFVEAHILQAEPVVMFLKSVSPPRPKTFSIEHKLSLSKFSRRETDISPVDYLSYVEVQNGEGKEIESNISGFQKILATCNGLVLATGADTSGLLVINPVTRKVLALPRANGSLHWLPSSGGCSCIASMGIDDEKFHTRILPNRSRRNDRLVEIGGLLSFVTHVVEDTLEIWILKESEGEGWVKRHTITGCEIRNLLPTCTMKRGRELFFIIEENHKLCVYDMETLEMRAVKFDGVALWRRHTYISCLPHVNTLASWESLVARW